VFAADGSVVLMWKKAFDNINRCLYAVVRERGSKKDQQSFLWL